MNDTRIYNIEVYLIEATGGVEFEREESALSFSYFDSIPQELKARPRLELADGGLGIECRLLGDAGLQLLQYPVNSEHFYLGFIFRIEVTRSVYVRLKREANS